MKEILASTKKGKEIIENIFKKIFYNLKKDDFYSYMKSKNIEKSQINDEYFSSDQLLQANDDVI